MMIHGHALAKARVDETPSARGSITIHITHFLGFPMKIKHICLMSESKMLT